MASVNTVVVDTDEDTTVIKADLKYLETMNSLKDIQDQINYQLRYNTKLSSSDQIELNDANTRAAYMYLLLNKLFEGSKDGRVSQLRPDLESIITQVSMSCEICVDDSFSISEIPYLNSFMERFIHQYHVPQQLSLLQVLWNRLFRMVYVPKGLTKG